MNAIADIVAFAGLASIGYALHCMYHPLAFLFGGAVAFVFAVGIHRSKTRKQNAH